MSISKNLKFLNEKISAISKLRKNSPTVSKFFKKIQKFMLNYILIFLMQQLIKKYTKNVQTNRFFDRIYS
jgi:hypothetical protein